MIGLAPFLGQVTKPCNPRRGSADVFHFWVFRFQVSPFAFGPPLFHFQCREGNFEVPVVITLFFFLFFFCWCRSQSHDSTQFYSSVRTSVSQSRCPDAHQRFLWKLRTHSLVAFAPEPQTLPELPSAYVRMWPFLSLFHSTGRTQSTLVCPKKWGYLKRMREPCFIAEQMRRHVTWKGWIFNSPLKSLLHVTEPDFFKRFSG